MKTVTVKGVGRASAPVDTVELSFRLWAKDKDYAKALEAADKKVTALETALTAAGFDAADFQTAGFHVNTEYESVRDKNGEFRTVFSGYNCSYDQLLRFGFDAARLGEALGAVAESKAQPELQVRFTVREPEKLEQALLRSAAGSAKVRAQVLAEASGKKLGELQRIDYDVTRLNFYSETGIEMADCMPQMAGGAVKAKRSFGAALRPQDVELSDTAVFVWELV
jgi:hypothetical protein